MIENYSLIIKRENIIEIKERIDQPYLFRIEVCLAKQIVPYAARPLNLSRPAFYDQTMAGQ
jgi:hypothetical protein